MYITNTNQQQFPQFIIVSASAGSGKTHTLLLYLLQLMLSPNVPNNALTNILAMTFTNNAANQIKKKLLDYLKRVYFQDTEIVRELQTRLGIPQEVLRKRCYILINSIIDNYSDFHVETIDSFFTRIFRTIAIELGMPFNYIITFSDKELLSEALPLFLDTFIQTNEGLSLIETILSRIHEYSREEQKYVWDPYNIFLEKISELFATLAHYSAEPTEEISSISKIHDEVSTLWNQIDHYAKQYGIDLKEQYYKQSKYLADKNYDKFYTQRFSIPFKKPQTKQKQTEYIKACSVCEPLLKRLSTLAAQYAEWKARTYYQPYIQFYKTFKPYYNEYKQREGTITLSDVSKKIAQILSTGAVPELFYYIGEQVYHYLIDEFQDTSPLQWSNIRPLCENALANGGSLFIVGDTKQSIFAFRGADWRIMKRLLENKNEFPSAPTSIHTLSTNYRSDEAIVQYVQSTFQHHIPSTLYQQLCDSERSDEAELIKDAITLSGLQGDTQKVHEKRRGKGRVHQYQLMWDTNPKEKILEIIQDCLAHGYQPKDIAVITPKNKTVLDVSSWLNETGIDFISYSALDIRNRKVIQELFTLLAFLDSPMDNLAFATVLLSNILKVNLERANICSHFDIHMFIHKWYTSHSHDALYKTFEHTYPLLWNTYFDDLFSSVGYLALYDLFTLAYKRFNIYNLFPQEEAALTQCLETLHSWEMEGQNDIQEFLTFVSQSTADAWTLEVPDLNAVSLMTIHQAKGLGFPVVILLLYDERPPNNNLYIEETDNELTLWWIINDSALISKKLQQKKYMRDLLSKVDELNKLYVSLTRAQHEMYIVTVLNERYKTLSQYLPSSSIDLSRSTPIVSDQPPHTLTPYHTSMLYEIKTHQRDRLNRRERYRGDILHEVLSHIKYISPTLDEEINSLVTQLNINPAMGLTHEKLLQTLNQLFTWNEFIDLYKEKEGRTVLCEAEFVTLRGQLYRMDRVIIDHDTVLVIDFKTGHEEKEYEQQIRTYMDILRDIYPEKNTKGALVYIDSQRIEWIQ
ncbi:MAG: UvrD-helicase domain-containing protein [Bacteroidetes bacterium]|nr:UvrD-helicase domain-containing protein [Bacteroidota bacterium]